MISTTKRTENYIDEHQAIKTCLKKGLINYSALARHMKQELNLQTVNEESILIAARRYKEKISKKIDYDEQAVINIFKSSNTTIKNNVVSFTIEKTVYPDSLLEIEKLVKKQKDLFFSIEGTKTITIITDKNHKDLVQTKFKNNIIGKEGLKENLSLITISSPGIQETPGCISYLTTLFFDNSINIEQFMSCHDDTLILVKSEELPKVVGKFF